MKDIDKKLAAYKNVSQKKSAAPRSNAELMHDIYIQQKKKSDLLSDDSGKNKEHSSGGAYLKSGNKNSSGGNSNRKSTGSDNFNDDVLIDIKSKSTKSSDSASSQGSSKSGGSAAGNFFKNLSSAESSGSFKSGFTKALNRFSSSSDGKNLKSEKDYNDRTIKSVSMDLSSGNSGRQKQNSAQSAVSGRTGKSAVSGLSAGEKSSSSQGFIRKLDKDKAELLKQLLAAKESKQQKPDNPGTAVNNKSFGNSSAVKENAASGFQKSGKIPQTDSSSVSESFKPAAFRPAAFKPLSTKGKGGKVSEEIKKSSGNKVQEPLNKTDISEKTEEYKTIGPGKESITSFAGDSGQIETDAVDLIVDKADAAGENSLLYKSAAAGNGYRKAAKFLMLLSKDESARILRQFADDEIEQIVRHMTNIRKIEAVEAEALMKEFSFLKERAQQPHGGLATARTILVNALGRDKAEDFIKKVTEQQQEPFAFLNDIDTTQLYLLLKKESPQVIALILSFLDKASAGAFLKMLSREKSTDIIRQLAVVKKPSNEIILSIEDKLREKLRKNAPEDKSEGPAGSSALAGILRYMDYHEEQELLDQLEKDLPDTAEEVRQRLLTMDLILGVDDVEFQEFLTEFTDSELAVIVKGQSAEIIDKIYNNVSSQRRADIENERQYMGPMRREDVGAAVKDFLSRLKVAQAEGRIYVYPQEKI